MYSALGFLRRLGLATWFVLATAACSGAGGSAQASPTPVLSGGVPSPSPAPARAQLIVVVEARGPGSHYAVQPGLGDSYDTVAIAGYDGFARARQTFKPRAIPVLPGGGTPVLPPPAVVTDGAVYYADGDGVVRRLQPDGVVTQIADFGTSPQQELWFGVSPDGRRLAATVVTVPAAGGTWTVDLDTATPGAAVGRVSHTDLGAATPSPALIAGWDLGGPLLTLDTPLVAAAGYVGGWQYHGSGLAHLDSSNLPGPPLGGAGCMPWSSAPDGSILCVGSTLTVRDPAGNVLWTVPAGSFQAAGRALSPDAAHVATSTVVIALDGWAGKLPNGFVAEGWSDPDHLVGQIEDPAGKGDADYVTVGDALRGHNLGFAGVIVGGVPAPTGVSLGLASPSPSPSP